MRFLIRICYFFVLVISDCLKMNIYFVSRWVYTIMELFCEKTDKGQIILKRWRHYNGKKKCVERIFRERFTGA